MPQGTPRTIGPCPECGEDVVYSGWGAPKKYCSVKCNLRVQSRRSRRRITSIPIAERQCRECGSIYTPKRAATVYCSTACYRRGNQKRPKFKREIRACEECGREYEAWRHDQRFCAEKCSHLYHCRAHMNRKRSGAHAPYIDREIFERDGWMCWLCNEPVDPTLSRRAKRGATIDHVVPLSKGGADVPENVRLAHMQCNREKSTRIVV